MAGAPVPPQLDQLGDRRFSFYPPIVNVEHNEWVMKEGSWSEILVHNTKSGEEVWIPRSYVGDVSRVDDPVMIVGLKRELEYKSGAVWPYTRRVLSMPANPVTARPPSVEEAPGKPTVGSTLRLESGTESGIGKMIGAALVIGLAAMVLIVAILKQRQTGGSVEYKGVLQMDLGFTGQTDYFDVVRKLGPPDADRWKAETGERQYRALVYRKNDLIVVLMGAERDKALYIGSKDSQWRTIHAISLPGGGNTEAILRTLPKF